MNIPLSNMQIMYWRRYVGGWLDGWIDGWRRELKESQGEHRGRKLGSKEDVAKSFERLTVCCCI